MTTKSKIYTKAGDKGKTRLADGSQVSKHDQRLETYGTVDELNAQIGMAVSYLKNRVETQLTSLTPNPNHTTYVLKSDAIPKLTGLNQHLLTIQNELFELGSILAKAPIGKFDFESSVQRIEKSIDQMDSEMPPLKNFILPGGSEASSALHVCRTVCRRAERLCTALYEKEEIEMAQKSNSVDPSIVIYLNRLSDFLFVAARYCNFVQSISDVIWTKK